VIRFDLVTTKTGDGGRSSDYSGHTDWKDAPVFGLVGELDELGSWLGVCKHLGRGRKELEACQRVLLQMGALVATNPADARYAALARVDAEALEALERWEASLMSRTTLKPVFVLVGGTRKSAWVDVARTVCRRAERTAVAFVRDQNRQDLVFSARWLNRLSDVLFVLARNYEG
jgi:ATP:cob(I)alamin adenosyltransferase